MAWQTATLITVGGLSMLGVERLRPPDTGGPVAVIVAPWEPGGMAFAGPVGLPIMDIGWGGRLVIFDSTPDPAAVRGLGLIAFSATTSALCSPSI